MERNLFSINLKSYANWNIKTLWGSSKSLKTVISTTLSLNCSKALHFTSRFKTGKKRKSLSHIKSEESSNRFLRESNTWLTETLCTETSSLKIYCFKTKMHLKRATLPRDLKLLIMDWPLFSIKKQSYLPSVELLVLWPHKSFFTMKSNPFTKWMLTFSVSESFFTYS